MIINQRWIRESRRHAFMKRRSLKKGICPECGQPLQLTFLNCTGSCNTISIAFQNLPCLACSNSPHAKWYINSGFSELMNVLFDSGQLPIARSGFLTVGRLKCYHCRGKLPKGAGEPKEFSGKLSMEGIPTFSLSIKAPSVRCDHCGAIQLLSSPEVSSDIADATIKAFDSVNIKPPSVYDGNVGREKGGKKTGDPASNA